MKILNYAKPILIALIPLFLLAFNVANKPVIDRFTLVTDESWEVSKGQTTFGEYPLTNEAYAAATKGLIGGNAPAVLANIYGESTLIEGAKPIWLTKVASEDFEVRQFKKTFILSNKAMQNASIKINCDDAARVYINGQIIGGKLDGKLNINSYKSFKFRQLSAYFYNRIFTYDIKPNLIAGGVNTIIVEVASESISNGHAYICARLDVDFIENTIAYHPPIQPVIKPTIKPEKKPKVVVKKPVEKPTIVAPKKEEEKKEPPIQVIENQPVNDLKPVELMEPTVFKTSNDVNVNKLKIGDVFELGNIYFKADDYRLSDESQTTLLELSAFLKANKSIKIEIGGHTNLIATNEYATKLSSERAKFVTDFLIKNGVLSYNLSFKGYGKSKPKMNGKTADANLKNQRVEVKILGK
jgi:outer membrane protein OmpA-like peptidoglycan-associated protein